MTSIKTTQTLVLDRYSRILVPLPPVQSIKDEVGKLVEDEFKIIPEYIETDWCEGYAISWRSWYGFEDCLRYPSMRSFFPLRLKRIIDDWLDEDEDMQVIEWIDEERWEWLDVVKDYAEIFHAIYPHEVQLYSESISIGSSRSRLQQEIRKYGFDELEEREELYSVFRILARRGYWNCSDLIIPTRRNQFYEKIGFNFALPF
jgi:hypothetical protein